MVQMPLIRQAFDVIQGIAHHLSGLLWISAEIPAVLLIVTTL